VRIRIEGASSPFLPERLAAGIARLRAAGFDVDDAHAGPRGRHAYLNGSDGERAASLQDALRSDVDVVWLARGGYGLGRIVDDLVVPERIPRVVGFSDTTALFARLWGAGHGRRCVHGPLATTLAAEPDDSFRRLCDIVAGRVPPPVHGLRAIATGGAGGGASGGAVDVVGPLFAGNVCVLASLSGTRSALSFADTPGAIVVLEEVGERPYRLDRMLTQLVRSGTLRGVGAVVIGQLTQCTEAPSSSSSSSSSSPRDAAPLPLDVVVDVLSPLGVPIVAGLAAGHETPNLALPLGHLVRLAGRGDDVTLHCLDEGRA
jgi:muramoyltetrapeptide carboxypeptidase